MTPDLPAFVPIVFLAAVFVTVAIFIWAVLRTDASEFTKRSIIAGVILWMGIHALLALSGTYVTGPDEMPRLMFLGPLPALAILLSILIGMRSTLVTALPNTLLTIIHIVRIPVELVLHWLAEAGWVANAMTFSGSNFDILTGITAPIIYLIAFGGGKIRRTPLIIWNIMGLILVFTIVTIAILAFPGPLQQISFEAPNRAMAYFPYVWLPAVVVPIVIFAHLASLYKLLTNRLT